MEKYIEVYKNDLEVGIVYYLDELENVLEDFTELERNKYDKLEIICDFKYKLKSFRTNKKNIIKILQKDIDIFTKKIDRLLSICFNIMKDFSDEEERSLFGYKMKLIDHIIDNIVVELDKLISKDISKNKSKL